MSHERSAAEHAAAEPADAVAALLTRAAAAHRRTVARLHTRIAELERALRAASAERRPALREHANVGGTAHAGRKLIFIKSSIKTIG